MPGYRPPSSEPRGKWAKRIHEKRRAEGLSQQAAFELLGERLGFGAKSRAAYIALDMGTRQPNEAESKVLAEWLGGYPSEEPSGAGASNDTTVQLVPAAYLDLLKAQSDRLDRQADTIDRLTELLRSLLPAIQPGAASEDLRLVEEAEGEYAEGQGLPGDTPSQRRSLVQTHTEGLRTSGPLVGAGSGANQR